MGFTMSLRVADMVGGVCVLVAVGVGGLGGSWDSCVRGAGLGAIIEGMGAARMVLEVEVLGWLLDWVEGVAVRGTAMAGGGEVLVVLVMVRVVREPE